MNAPQNLPAYLTGRTSRGLAQALVANLGVGSPPFLSIMGNRFTLIDGAGEEIAVPTYDPKIGPYIDICVIDALERTSKIFYDKAYDPNAESFTPPACFSDNGIGPSRNAFNPQSPTCASCPQGAWGSKVSAVSGKGVKACNDIQKIGFLYPGYEMPFLLRVPPNSRTNFRGYVNKFVGQPVDVSDVMTRVSFEQGQIGTLKFEAVGWLDEQTVVPQRDKLIAAKATDAIVGRTDLPRQDALPAPAAQPALAAPQATVQVAGGPVQPMGDAGHFQQGQVYQVPFMPPAQNAGVPQASVQPTPATASPSEPPRQRRKRNSGQAAAQGPLPGQMPLPMQPGPVQTAAPPQQAPFMSGAAPQATTPTPNNFGIQPGAPANPDLQNTLNGLFGAPK